MKRIIYSIAIALAAVSCIKNDIPYPQIQANIRSISAQGELRAALIDSVQRVVTLYFPEQANIYDVTISDYSLTPKAYVVDDALSHALDLSSPLTVTVALYQDYEWTIQASQQIERTFSVASQMGASVIDPGARTVEATVAKNIDLSRIEVLECKIAPTSAVVTPDLVGKYVNFTSPVTVSVDNYGHKEEWTITVTHALNPVATLSVDAWTRVAWVYCEAEAGKQNGVQYRIKGDTEWLWVPDSEISHSGGNYFARIAHLSPSTTYEARAVSDEVCAPAVEFTTGEEEQMPNSDFNEWWLDGKVWCPWPEGGTAFWGTGNKGATTLGPSNSTPTDDTVDGHGQAARLETKFVGIGPFGKLAAGNIFAGRYVRTDGTNGVLSFGRPFTQRPTKLRGYMKYTTAPISSTTTGFEDWKGRPDTCCIWIALIDLDEPLEIRTDPKDRQLFDENASYVIAYGRLQCGYDVEAYTPFEVELEYRSTSRVPKYIMCAGSASKYGDYFTGGNGAVLYLDDFSLDYDY